MCKTIGTEEKECLGCEYTGKLVTREFPNLVSFGILSVTMQLSLGISRGLFGVFVYSP